MERSEFQYFLSALIPQCLATLFLVTHIPAFIIVLSAYTVILGVVVMCCMVRLSLAVERLRDGFGIHRKDVAVMDNLVRRTRSIARRMLPFVISLLLSMTYSLLICTSNCWTCDLPYQDSCTVMSQRP